MAMTEPERNPSMSTTPDSAHGHTNGAYLAGVDVERARVAAWLRSKADQGVTLSDSAVTVLSLAADMIDSGQHVTENTAQVGLDLPTGYDWMLVDKAREAVTRARRDLDDDGSLFLRALKRLRDSVIAAGGDGSLLRLKPYIEWAMKAHVRAASGEPPAAGACPVVVTLCGSTRFGHAFREANLRETLAGRIVQTIGCDMRSDGELFADLPQDEVEKIKERLDLLHLWKIYRSDEILVLNVGRYIGESTRREIEYAQQVGKRIRYLVDPDPPAAGVEPVGDTPRTDPDAECLTCGTEWWADSNGHPVLDDENQNTGKWCPGPMRPYATPSAIWCRPCNALLGVEQLEDHNREKHSSPAASQQAVRRCTFGEAYSASGSWAWRCATCGRESRPAFSKGQAEEIAKNHTPPAPAADQEEARR